MSDPLETWFDSLPAFEGLLACGLRLPDHRTHGRSFAEAYPLDALEGLSRGLADTSRVLGMHRLPSEALRWTYESAVVHCHRRADGLLMFWVIDRNAAETTGEELNRQIAAFRG